MTSKRCTLPLWLSLALVGACGGSPGAQDSAPAKVDAKAKAGKAGGTANAKDPHAAVNPHAGMPPMMGTATVPKGPPRDVTPSGRTAAESLPGLAFAVPSEWEKGEPSSNMRLAQWVLPGPGGDGELVVFRFPGGAGGIEANVARWKGQFQAPEGKTIDDVTVTKTIEAGGVKTTLVDVSGRYVAAVMPGAEEKHDDADQRMLAAIVEGSGDPFYFKAVGPRATMDVWAAAFEAMANGFSGAGTAVVPGSDAAAGGEAKADAKADAKGSGDAKAETKKAGG
jgi:hypothetical protein